MSYNGCCLQMFPVHGYQLSSLENLYSIWSVTADVVTFVYNGSIGPCYPSPHLTVTVGPIGIEFEFLIVL